MSTLQWASFAARNVLRSGVAVGALLAATASHAAADSQPTATQPPATPDSPAQAPAAQPVGTPTTATPSAADQPAGALREIVVTAQRRGENLQKVPIAVNVVTGAQLSQRGADSINTLSAAVPNVSTTGSFNSNVYIRGIGANSASSNNEPSVATYVDGVYMPSNIGLRGFPFNNIQRVEVLKGPQGTLFGRNATAGVIQFITPDPKHEFSADLSAGYANYNTISTSDYVTGPISNTVAADLAVLYENQMHGWGYNPNFHTDINKHRTAAVRSKWLYTPNDTSRVTFEADYSRYRSDGGNNHLVPGSISGADHVSTYPGDFNALGTPNIANETQYGGSVRIEQDMGAVKGISITSYRYISGHWRADNDLGPKPLVQVDNYNRAHYVTQELQLTNRNPGWITWLVGGFFDWNRVYGADPQANRGTNVAGGYRAMFGVQDTQSESVYGQATANVLTDTRLTLGLRYTNETLTANGATRNAADKIVSGPFKSEIHSKPWTWRVALDHQFTPGILGYVSYNRGFKSGGYNLSSPGSAPFYPETVDAYETGIKSTFLNHHARLNIAGFYYNYRNLQVAIVPGGGSQIFTNAARARNYGLDATLDLAVTSHFTVSTAVGLLSAKYRDYPNAQGFTILGKAFPIPNAAGQDLPYAPHFTGNLYGEYNVPMATGDLTATAGVSYTAKSYVTPDEGLVRPAYTLLNASLEWHSHGWWGVRVWGKNLLNKVYYASGVESSNGWYVTDAPPRTFGVTLLANIGAR